MTRFDCPREYRMKHRLEKPISSDRETLPRLVFALPCPKLGRKELISVATTIRSIEVNWTVLLSHVASGCCNQGV